MGLIWNLIQQSQISDQRDQTASVEQRVASLEQELRNTQENLLRLLHILEQRFGEDLDGDGRVGPGGEPN